MHNLRSRHRSLAFAVGVIVALLTARAFAQVVGPYTILPSLHLTTSGSAGAPTIGWTGSSTVGFYYPGGSVVGISGALVPGADATYDLGSGAARFRNLYFSGAIAGTGVQFGDGSAGSPSITFASETTLGLYRFASGVLGVSGNVKAGADDTYDLGAAAANRFANAYFSQKVAGTAFQVGAGAPATTNLKLSNAGSFGFLSIPYLNLKLGDDSAFAGMNVRALDVEAVQIDPTYGDAQPACASGVRGTLWYLQGASGVADQLQICGRAADATYAWVTLQ